MGERTHTISRRSFLGGAAAFGVISVATPMTAHAATSAEVQAQADAVRSQVVNAQATLEAASENYYAALSEHDAAVAAVQECQATIDADNARIAKLQTKLKSRARSMYRSGNSTFIDLLLGATSFEEFATNWDLLNDLNEEDAAMVQETKDLKAEVEAQKTELDQQEQIAATKADEAAAAQADAAATTASLQTALNSLDAEAQQLLEQEAAAAAVQAAAQASAAVEYTDPGTTSGGGTTGGGETNYSGGSSSIPTNGSVVDYALSRIGCPYVWGAEGPNSFDCSGLTKWCYAQVGKSIPHQSESQYSCAQAVMPVSSAAPGDILWRYGHVGIAQVSGGTTYIHAPTFGAYVRNTDSLSWSGFTAALRI